MSAAEASSAASAAASSSAAAPEVNLDAISEQMEYYFGDSNFRRDKFLRAKVAEDAGGFVPLTVFCTFNRMKTLNATPENIAQALDDSDELELSEDKAAVRRVRPLPEEDDSEQRSVYVKGPFPSTATLEDMRAFAAAYGAVKRVLLRRMKNKEKSFKGSIFVEFATAPEAAALLEKQKAGEVLFEGRKVDKVEAMAAYFERKKKERDSRRASKEKKAAAAAEAAPPAKVFEKKMTPGLILRVTGLGAAASIDSLQVWLNTLGELKFVELDSAAGTAHARYEAPEQTKAAAEAVAAGGPNVKTATGADAPTAVVLEGADELAYWEKIWEHQLARYNAHRSKRGGRGGRGGRGRGRGGRGGGGRGGGYAGQKRGREDDGGNDGPSAKRAHHDD